MSEQGNSSWYRIAGLKLRLRPHAKIVRQDFRGQPWYVVQDPFSGRFHRFTPATYLLINMMDGERNMQEIWDDACEQLGDGAPDQDDILRLLAQLHASDLLQGEQLPNISEITERGTRLMRRKTIMGMLNPLAVRLPLLDPDRFLTLTFPLVRPLFSWFGGILIIATLLTGATLSVLHWEALTHNLADRVLATESLLILLLTYPVIKAIHELGHGYAVRNWGGEVHEMGLMFLVFVPVPYVDATAATAFDRKWHRALVGAAGIIVEGVLACLALVVWLNAEPGLLKALAFNVMLIGGVSTVLFNGNPLLRFDGYFVLSDILEIPNMGFRSTRYLGYLIQRYLFGMQSATSPATVASERKWLFGYAIASFCYRMIIMFWIVTFVATKFFIIGVLMACWSVLLMIGLPLFKQLRFVFSNPAVGEKRLRAIGVVALAVAMLLVFVGLVPLPHRTIADGVILPQEEAGLVANESGTIIQLSGVSNTLITKGQVILRLEDPFLEAEIAVLREVTREARIRHATAQVVSPIEEKLHNERYRRAQAELRDLLRRQNNLVITSPRDGRLIVPEARDLLGRFVRKGEVIGFVVDPIVTRIHAIIDEADADTVQQKLLAVSLRFVDDPQTTVPAEIVRRLPAITKDLPSLALTTAGGGDVTIDPDHKDTLTALQRLLHLEIRPKEDVPLRILGARVLVLFDHGMEPLYTRIYRQVRQVFLERFNV